MEIKTDPVDIKYEIGDDIGRGKFATVKRCRDRNTGSEYAAKFIRKSRGTSRRGAKMENIEKEIQILSDTNHRNIINLYEVYDTKREVILILELVDGGELFEYLSEKDKLCEEEASAFVKQILDGVEHLHAQDIAHLDLKPENILLQDKNGTAVKLIDFGLSRKILPKEDHRAIMGTAEFCAPEVISFEPLSVQTDMWSIGVITYVLLSGLSPFLGDNQQETYHNITSINFEFDEEYFNGTSDLAKDFIQKLLVKDVRKRATIHDCLNHPWIKPVEKRDKVLRRSSVINTEHLKKFIARQRWKRSMKVVSLCNRLSRSMQLRRILSSDTIGSTSGTSEEDTDDMTDTEKQESDRESNELERSYKENVKKELVETEDMSKKNDDLENSNKELVISNNIDTANINYDMSPVKATYKGNTGIANCNKGLAEFESSIKENAGMVDSNKELTDIDDTYAESDNIDNSNKELADIENTNVENVSIFNSNNNMDEIEGSNQDINDIAHDGRDLSKTDKQNSDILHSSKESAEIDDAVGKSADIGENSETADNITYIQNAHLADNETNLATFHNKSTIFNETLVDNNELLENDCKDPANASFGHVDLTLAKTSDKNIKFQISSHAEDFSTQSLLEKVSHPELKGKSDSETVDISFERVGFNILESQTLEPFGNLKVEPKLMHKGIETENFTLAHEVGEFDDDIGLLVSGTFESKFDLTGETGTNSNIDCDKSDELSCRNVDQKKRFSFSIIGSSDINVTAQHLVAQVIETSLCDLLGESANGMNSNVRSVLHPGHTRESGDNALAEERKGKKHFRHYDPLRLVCFEIDDVSYQVSTDEETDEDIENYNNDTNIPKMYRKLTNVNEEGKGERKKVDNKENFFKPLISSKLNFHGRKHSGQRSYRRTRKVRPELKVKKKANRFWEMEDCTETGRYEMFEMQVLNNSE